MAKDQSNEVREINSQTVVGQTVIKANEDQIACDGKRVSLFFSHKYARKKVPFHCDAFIAVDNFVQLHIKL